MNDDTISRAAAISEVKKLCEGCYLSEHCGKCLTKCLVRKSINQLKKVPPSQPSATDTNVGGNLISRQAAIDAIQKLNIPEDMCVFEIMSHIEVEIATLPTVQPQRMKGAWINDGRIIRCNKCKTGYAAVKGMKSALTYDFCPNCGADMRCSENPNS